MSTTQNIMIMPEAHEPDEVDVSVAPDEVDVVSLPERASAIIHAKNEPNVIKAHLGMSIFNFCWVESWCAKVWG